MGANTILIQPGQATSGGVSFGSRDRDDAYAGGLRRDHSRMPERRIRCADHSGAHAGCLQQPQLGAPADHWHDAGVSGRAQLDGHGRR